MWHQEILDVQKMVILKMQRVTHQLIVGLYGKKVLLESLQFGGSTIRYYYC
jgi:hypothetical protein